MAITRRAVIAGLLLPFLPARANACWRRRRASLSVAPSSGPGAAAGAGQWSAAPSGPSVVVGPRQRLLFRFISRNTTTYYALIAWDASGSVIGSVPGIPFEPGMYLNPTTPNRVTFTAIREPIPGNPNSVVPAQVALDPQNGFYFIYLTYGGENVTLSLQVA